MLTLPAFNGAEVVAGAAGFGRIVRRANVMEVPDILPWVRPDALLLTTGYPLRDRDASGLARLVADLDARGVAALAVKLHRYLDVLPPPMLDEADRRGLPVVVVPEAAGFDEILSEVFTRAVNERASLIERSDEVHRQLLDMVLAGGGVDEVAASVSALLGGVALVTTPDGEVTSEAGPEQQRTSLRESPVFAPDGRLRLESVEPGFSGVDDLPGSSAVVRVRGGRIDHGRLVLFTRDRVLSPADLAVLERAGTVAAICLSKELAVTAVESKYRGDFLRDVLAGRGVPLPEVLAHARALGWDLARPCVVVVAVPEATMTGDDGYQRPVLVERLADAWRSTVAALGSGTPVVGFASEVVALLPVRAGRPHRPVVDRVVKRVHASAAGRGFATGVSRMVTVPEGLPAGYEQAGKAVQVGRQLHGPNATVHFDDLGVFRLLGLIEDERELAGFVAETLGPLAERTPEAADLRTTLQTLLDTNLNVAESARCLHFHYNTLRYRITKLEHLVGPFTTDPRLRLDLALALRVVTLSEL